MRHHTHTLFVYRPYIDIFIYIHSIFVHYYTMVKFRRDEGYVIRFVAAAGACV